MKETLLFLLLLASASTEKPNEKCKHRTLSNPSPPSSLTFDVNATISDIIFELNHNANRSSISRKILSQEPSIVGLMFVTKTDQVLTLKVSGRVWGLQGKTTESEDFWDNFSDSEEGWNRPFKNCFLHNVWINVFRAAWDGGSLGLFVKLKLTQCDESLKEIYNGSDLCDRESTVCVDYGKETEVPGKYRCVCRHGFYYMGANSSWEGFRGEDIQSGNDSFRCLKCPEACNGCDGNGMCLAEKDVYLKTAILCVQLVSMTVTVILGLVVFKQRKTKAIASGMWTILETILLGIFILYLTVVVKFFEPSVTQCLLEPWTREVGFIICYGAIILKLYRHLIEFRTRKAHRWVVKDTDLLKYLLIMIMSVLAYMAAYTSITLNLLQENYSLLYNGTLDVVYYQACKSLWWDYVTETGELVILIFGIHLSYASRNARTQFHERSFLCAAISVELAVSTIFYISRIFVLPELHPNYVLVVYCIRTHLSTTVTLLLVFIPKFWYQQKQVRSLAQEYSCRIPVDAFKDGNAHGPLTGNNSDVDVGEVTLADMSPDDIRAELKRLYLQLEIFKSKTICRDNPHISKRRGGRKAQHRRFSLQNLHGKHREKERQKQQLEETTEAEPSRTPEDSVCSNEGPSAIYADLPSTTHSSDHK